MAYIVYTLLAFGAAGIGALSGCVAAVASIQAYEGVCRRGVQFIKRYYFVTGQVATKVVKLFCLL